MIFNTSFMLDHLLVKIRSLCWCFCYYEVYNKYSIFYIKTFADKDRLVRTQYNNIKICYWLSIIMVFYGTFILRRKTRKCLSGCFCFIIVYYCCIVVLLLYLTWLEPIDIFHFIISFFELDLDSSKCRCYLS